MERSRWSLVWPIAIGVLIGNILTAILAFVASIAFAGALLSAILGERDLQSTTPGHLPARYETSADAVPTADGPLTAESQGRSRACVGGFFADRYNGKWQQAQPRKPCTATSN